MLASADEVIEWQRVKVTLLGARRHEPVYSRWRQ